ncbi:hypothetical protein OHA25_54745 [Nonomuraea sp. NBC_00507]|uniref:hypothetical protein n=1 Tax=Nonomuraea sp. NBC_00507 TaxID=2976002 RepID=UPI002E18E32B
MKRTIVATALLAALAVGCAGQQGSTGVASVSRSASPPPASSGATPTGTADPQEQGMKFAQCMREQGIPMEDPDPNGGGGLRQLGEDVDRDKVQKAIEACRDYAPSRDRTQLNPEQIEQMRQFAQCMRDNGVDMPDPNPDGTMGSGEGRNFNRDDPQFQKAFDACQDKFPRTGETT